MVFLLVDERIEDSLIGRDDFCFSGKRLKVCSNFFLQFDFNFL